MREQHEEAKKNAEIENTVQSDDNGEYTPVAPEKEYGFVAVAAGDGIESLFTDLGADKVVSGGQTMNPSTDDILRAVETTPAKTVFVLPNNKNIIMAAEQTTRFSTRKVVVLQTKSVPMGISAMLVFDPDADVDTNASNMQAAADSVGTGSITFAARDSDYEGHKIKEGEILALENNKLSFVEQDLERAVVKLTKQLFKKDSEFVIDLDCVIMALGTSPNPLIKDTTKNLDTQKWGGIITDEGGRTSLEGVFAGGDAVTGAATVILAMGAGKTAADSIDKYIMGK